MLLLLLLFVVIGSVFYYKPKILLMYYFSPCSHQFFPCLQKQQKFLSSFFFIHFSLQHLFWNFCCNAKSGVVVKFFCTLKCKTEKESEWERDWSFIVGGRKIHRKYVVNMIFIHMYRVFIYILAGRSVARCI